MKTLVIELSLADKVTFMGILTKRQVRELIIKSDAAILLSSHEGSPISVKEILACGKPVIVNDVGDLSDYIIPDKNGYIVNAENSYEVASAIVKVFDNSDSMREACVTSMYPFDEAVICGTIAKYIFNLSG